MREVMRAKVLEILEMPRTIQEAAEIAGCGYHAMRNYINILREEGTVVEAPLVTPTGALQWVKGTANLDSPVVMVQYRNKLLTLGDALGMLSDKGNKMNETLEAMAFLYFRSLIQEENGGKLDMSPLSAQVGQSDPAQVRIQLMENRKTFTNMVSLLTQILSKDDLFKADPSVHAMFGPTTQELEKTLRVKGVRHVDRDSASRGGKAVETEVVEAEVDRKSYRDGDTNEVLVMGDDKWTARGYDYWTNGIGEKP